MKLYPPYNNWEVEIQNLEEFQKYLKKNIESGSLKGKISQTDFQVERKLVYYNTGRPQIKGIIEASPIGKAKLSLSIVSRNTFLYVLGFFAIMMSITAISQSNPIVLIGIPIAGIWFYIIGLILHNIEIRKTKIELERILKKAIED